MNTTITNATGSQSLMKYFYWRDLSLWCTFQLPGYPQRFPLKIYAINEKDKARCTKLGEIELARLRTAAFTGKVLDRENVPEKEYSPTYGRLVARYWYYHLRFKRCAKDDRYHLLASLRHFGKKDALSITREDIVLWREQLRSAGTAVATINRRFAYLRCVFNWAASESTPHYRFMYNPTNGMHRLSGENIRTFVLTQEQFEKNYFFFLNGLPWKERPTKHHSHFKHLPDPLFAQFYLALWETSRRPLEVAQYTWEMITTLQIPAPSGVIRSVRVINVPPQLIGKTDEFDTVVISDRLWKVISVTLDRSGLLFKNSRGNQWTHWSAQQNRLYSVFGDKCGVIRDCRRGSITHSVEVEGHDPIHVKMQSGHKTNSMFERYRIGKMIHVIDVVNKTAYQGDINVSNS